MLHRRAKSPQDEESGSTEPPVEAWMLRLTLEAAGLSTQPLRAAGGHEELTERLRTAWADASPAVWIKDIDLRCRPEADMEALRSGDNLLGETLRLVQQARDALDIAAQKTAVQPQWHRSCFQVRWRRFLRTAGKAAAG